MSRIKRLAVVGILCLGGVVLASLGNTALAGNDNGRRCRFEGTWFGGQWIYENVTSVDSANNEVVIAMDWVLDDPTWNVPDLCDGQPGFPAAVALTTIRGGAVRRDRRTFDFTLVAYGLSSAPQSVVYILVGYGEKVLSEDCTTYEVTATIEIYAPGADGNADGLPDDGASPVCTFPPGDPDTFVRLALE
jgi:hypothetical protein